jgi:hypothetical protein
MIILSHGFPRIMVAGEQEEPCPMLHPSLAQRRRGAENSLKIIKKFVLVLVVVLEVKSQGPPVSTAEFAE